MIGGSQSVRSCQAAMKTTAPATRSGSRVASAALSLEKSASGTAEVLLRGGQRQAIGIEEVVVREMRLRLIDQRLLLRSKRLALRFCEEIVGLGPVVDKLVPDRTAPDDVIRLDLAGRDDAVRFEVLDGRTPDIRVVGRTVLVVVVLLVILEGR